jgi:hypothetical protein
MEPEPKLPKLVSGFLLLFAVWCFVTSATAMSLFYGLMKAKLNVGLGWVSWTSLIAGSLITYGIYRWALRRSKPQLP